MNAIQKRNEEANAGVAKHLSSYIRNAAILAQQGHSCAWILGDASRTVHKVWPRGEHAPEARVFLTPADAKFFMWSLATQEEEM